MSRKPSAPMGAGRTGNPRRPGTSRELAGADVWFGRVPMTLSDGGWRTTARATRFQAVQVVRLAMHRRITCPADLRALRSHAVGRAGRRPEWLPVRKSVWTNIRN